MFRNSFHALGNARGWGTLGRRRDVDCLYTHHVSVLAECSLGSPCYVNVSQSQLAHRPAPGSSAAAAAQKHST
eukprot:5226010-Alexandrium_andersonii.AAC.1